MKQKDSFLKKEGDAYFERKLVSLTTRKYPEEDTVSHVLLDMKDKITQDMKILEIGCGDGARLKFIEEHLIMVHRAIKNGAPIKGYFHWSLLDNFEWKWGFTPKFGLYEVDRQSLQRRPRPSSRFYAKICKNNGF